MYTGPILLAPAALRKRWAKQMPDHVAEMLDERSVPDKRGATLVEIGSETVLLLNDSSPTRFQAVGAGGVLVRLCENDDVDFDEEDSKQVRRALDVDFGAIKPSAWRPQKKVVFDVGASLELFASGAAVDDRGDDLSSFLPIPLATGRYDIDVAVVTQGERTLELLRLRPHGRTLDMSGAPRPAPQAKAKKMELEVSPAVAALTKRTAWVGTDGGPVIALRKEDASRWKAAKQYDDVADESFGLVKSKGVEVLVLPSPNLTGFVPTAVGGIFVRCDYGEASACVAIALAAKNEAWTTTKLRMKTGSLLLGSAAEDGKKGRPCTLAKGTYAIDVLSAATATVDGEDAAVRGCVRLRREP